jgi:hypothetical protein
MQEGRPGPQDVHELDDAAQRQGGAGRVETDPGAEPQIAPERDAPGDVSTDPGAEPQLSGGPVEEEEARQADRYGP